MTPKDTTKAPDYEFADSHSDEFYDIPAPPILDMTGAVKPLKVREWGPFPPHLETKP